MKNKNKNKNSEVKNELENQELESLEIQETNIKEIKEIKEDKEEDSVFINKEDKESSAFIKEVEDVPLLSYYKISFIQNSKRREIFTKQLPIISHNGLEIIEPFEKIILKEKILNKKVLTLECNLNLNTPSFSLTLEQEVLIKKCEKEKWMEVLHSTAENFFNKRVLEAYRTYSQHLNKNNENNKDETIEGF